MKILAGDYLLAIIDLSQVGDTDKGRWGTKDVLVYPIQQDFIGSIDP